MIKLQEVSILPTAFGKYKMYAYSENSTEKMPHIALLHVDHDPSGPTTARIHSECLTGDIFSSKRCDCGEQLTESLKIINRDKGLLLYLRQEVRGIGLLNKMKAYNHQDLGLDTVEANTRLGFLPDERKYDIAISIIENLKIDQLNLITNNPLKLKAFDDSSIEVVKRIPMIIDPNEVNEQYLKTKEDQMGHIFSKS